MLRAATRDSRLHAAGLFSATLASLPMHERARNPAGARVGCVVSAHDPIRLNLGWRPIGGRVVSRESKDDWNIRNSRLKLAHKNIARFIKSDINWPANIGAQTDNRRPLVIRNTGAVT